MAGKVTKQMVAGPNHPQVQTLEKGVGGGTLFPELPCYNTQNAVHKKL